MEIFFALVLVIGTLVAEQAAVRRADKYADLVVRRYE